MEPHVPMSATEAKTMASSVGLSSGLEKISRNGFAAPDFCTDSRQRSDSGTNKRMKNVSAAGAAPTIITQRHESFVTGKKSAIVAMTT